MRLSSSNRKYSLAAKGDLDRLNDVFIEIDYVGDRGMAFIGGLLVTDHFHNEKKWEVGLKGFISKLSGKEMVLKRYGNTSADEPASRIAAVGANKQ